MFGLSDGVAKIMKIIDTPKYNWLSKKLSYYRKERVKNKNSYSVFLMQYGCDFRGRNVKTAMLAQRKI